MPQLNPEFFISQLFWLIIAFSFLIIFLWRISLPRISSVLEKREAKINNDIESAKKLQTEAEKIQKEIELKILKSHENANNLIKDSISELNDNTNKELTKLDNEMNEKVIKAANIIEKNKNDSLKNINEQIENITKLIISKISSVKISDQEITQSIKSIRNKELN